MMLPGEALEAVNQVLGYVRSATIRKVRRDIDTFFLEKHALLLPSGGTALSGAVREVNRKRHGAGPHSDVLRVS
jgi:hypothetical protein